MIDMKVFDGIINTTLLNEIVAFVLDTAGADYTQRRELEARCIFYDNKCSGDALQEKYSLKAEQDAWAAAELEAERQRQAAEVQAIRDEVDSANGSFQVIYRNLDGYRYRQGKLTAACQIVRDKLPGILEGRGYRLGGTELAAFLRVCARLINTDGMNLMELQDYISRIKECEGNDNAICKAG